MCTVSYTHLDVYKRQGYGKQQGWLQFTEKKCFTKSVDLYFFSEYSSFKSFNHKVFCK